jgi:hypothetical protein
VVAVAASQFDLDRTYAIREGLDLVRKTFNLAANRAFDRVLPLIRRWRHLQGVEGY